MSVKINEIIQIRALLARKKNASIQDVKEILDKNKYLHESQLAGYIKLNFSSVSKFREQLCEFSGREINPTDITQSINNRTVGRRAKVDKIIENFFKTIGITIHRGEISLDEYAEQNIKKLRKLIKPLKLCNIKNPEIANLKIKDIREYKKEIESIKSILSMIDANLLLRNEVLEADKLMIELIEK